jgi:Hemerythrin HHE cation binding domain
MVVDTQSSQGYREDHEELADHVEHIRLAARELDQLSPEERATLVGRVLEFLEGRLIPHATAEEHTFYAAVAELFGSQDATAPMAYDHLAIRQRVAALRDTDPEDLAALQELLYGLYALIVVHFWKEEAIYFPLLDAEPDS